MNEEPLRRYFNNLDDCEKSGYRVPASLVPVRLPDGRITMAVPVEPVHKNPSSRFFLGPVVLVSVVIFFACVLVIGYTIGHAHGMAVVR